MPKRKFIGLLSTLGFAARFVKGQLEPDCNPLHTDCPAKKAWPEQNYYVDFTKQTGPPKDWTIANNEVVNFTSRGAEFTYGKKGDAPNMWTDFYMLGGRYDVEMQIAPGQGVISSAVLWSDIQDEIDWEFSGNQHGEKPFPPPDGKWTVETNVFAQGKMWDGAATYQKDVVNPTTEFHTYSVEWDEDHMNWYVDNNVVRSVQASNTPSGFTFPQSPMKLQLGVWGGGDPANNYWTIQWAGGEIDMKGVPYTMYVSSVNITNKYPACEYKYKDRSGKIAGIDQIHDGCSSSTTSPKIIKNSLTAESPTAMGIDPSSTILASAGTGYPVASSAPGSFSTSSAGNTVTSQPTSSSLATTSDNTHSIIGSYPVASSDASQATPSTPASSYLVASSASSSNISTSAISSGYPVGSPSASSVSTTSAASSSYPVASSATSVFTPSAISSGYPVASSVISSESTPSTTTTSGYPVASSSTSLSSEGMTSTAATTSGYPIASSTISSGFTTSPGPSSYPVGSSTSPGGILSSLSSIFLGTSSVVLSSTASSVPGSNETYPVTLTTASVSTSLTSESSTIEVTTTSAGSSAVQSSIVGNNSTSTGSITSSTISTVYSTNIYTITSCASGVESCPVGHVTSELISLTTTLCPVTGSGSVTTSNSKSGSPTPSTTPPALSTLSSSLETGTSLLSSFVSSLSSTIVANTSSETMPATYTFSSEITTSVMSTVYSTNIITITSCAPTVTNCPARVTTETVSMYTTICPVTNTIIDDKTYSGQPSQVGSTTPATPFVPIGSYPTPPASLSPASSASSDSSATSLVPSVGTSSSVLMSSVVYPNTTVLATGGPSTVTQNPTSLTEQLSSTPIELTTSTVYSTNIYTITSCAPSITNCPGLGQVTTELVSLYTTICPVTQEGTTSLPESPSIPVHTSASSVPSYTSPAPLDSSISSSPVLTTSTVYTSSVYTVTSCAPGAIGCSSNIGSVTTELVPVYTTVCPVKDQPTTSTLLVSTQTPGSGLSSTLAETSSSPSLLTPSSAPVTPIICTTSTVYSTNIYTTTNPCPSTDGSCSQGTVTKTEVVAISTTVCPVSGKTSPVDVPSYSMTETESTAEMTFSTTIEATAPFETLPSNSQGGSSQCICEPTTSTVYATVTVAETTTTSTKTVEPPFPSTYGTGTGGVPLGTGYPTGTGAPKRRWFRRAQAGHGHGHH